MEKIVVCNIRRLYGDCDHYQCEFSHLTKHGYNCVEFYSGECEAGNNCIEKCEHSFKK